MSHNYLNKRFEVNSPSLEGRGLGGGKKANHLCNVSVGRNTSL